MELPEEIQERIAANKERYMLLLEEVRILMSEHEHFMSMSREILKWVYDKNDYGKGSRFWIDKSLRHLNQAAKVREQSSEKISELNELSGGVMDFYQNRGISPENEILNSVILYLNNDITH